MSKIDEITNSVFAGDVIVTPAMMKTALMMLAEEIKKGVAAEAIRGRGTVQGIRLGQDMLNAIDRVTGYES